MLNEKFRTQWPLFLMMGFITLVYVPAALILLRNHELDIEFTQKELRGLVDYQRIMTRYFALHEQTPLDKVQANQLRDQIRAIGDESNLILDPEIHSYYAMYILFQHIPLLVEHVEMYRLDALSMRDGPYHLERLHYSMNKVLDFYSPQQAFIREKFSGIQERLAKLQHMSDVDQSFFLGQLKQMKEATASLLSDLLHKRLVKQQRHYYLVLVIVMMVYLVLIALIVVAARNYADKREVNLARQRQSLIIRLEEKNAELEHFSYAAAHDLKEPVRTMRSFAMLLAEEMGEELSAAAKNYIYILKSTAKRAELMINDLLNYSHINDEKLTIESCNAAAEIGVVLQDLQLRIDEAQAKITVGEMLQIHTVPSMFRRVILNLVDNAIKYRKNDAPPEIEISASPLLEGWRFCVRDNGIGIAPEYHASVFEPFRRLQLKTSEGNGIGLATCKKTVERLGGRIWLESSIGQGTTVYFTIPASL